MQFRKEWVAPITIAVSTCGVSFGIGYMLGKRYSREIITVVNSIKTDDIPEVDEDHSRILPEFDYTEVEEIDFRDPIVEEQAILETLMEEREVIELDHIRQAHADGLGKFNIFEGAEDDWDYSVEVPLRGTVEPYIIHRDEFESNEEGNSQSTLTYYALDDILCDEKDTPIYNHNNLVGELVFGKGSRDISICYVRNPRLGSEWEIIIDHGSFQVQVLGEEVEQRFEDGDIKHSRHPRKFREDE